MTSKSGAERAFLALLLGGCVAVVPIVPPGPPVPLALEGPRSAQVTITSPGSEPQTCQLPCQKEVPTGTVTFALSGANSFKAVVPAHAVRARIRRSRPGLFWTGIALSALAGAALITFSGLYIQSNKDLAQAAATCDLNLFDRVDQEQKAAIGLGLSGAVLLIPGAILSLPQISLRPNAVFTESPGR